MAEVLVVAVCLILNACFAAYEMAFVSVPKGELRKLARTGDRVAQRLLLLRDSPERTLSVIQIGITLVGTISAAVGGAGASESIEPFFRERLGLGTGAAEALSIILVVLPITYLNVTIGELVPKSLALRSPLKITLGAAPWLFLADRLLRPFVGVLEFTTKKILRTVFPRSTALVSTPETTVEIGALSRQHQQYVLNMAAIERKQIKDILVLWNKVNYVQSTDTLEEVTAMVFSSGHTRLPVVHQGKAVGILHTKEFIAFRESGGTDWRLIMRPLLRVQKTDSALGVLRLMQEKRSHLAVVEDCIGIVTLEDISEEIWGEIYDEDADGGIRKLLAARLKGRTLPRQ